MSLGCNYDGCAVADTGRCALERDPGTCPNRVTGVGLVAHGEDATSVALGASPFAPELSSPEEKPSFPRSGPLGLFELEALMAAQYVTVVGILGDPESGKTACLASLYLLVSNAQLEGWSFADSRSLMAFEEISRGARRWNEGQPPEQMTVHTEMADEREPGFLHLRLRRASDGRRVDLALPDLPGEWTKSLVRTARSDRLAFMGAADAIWIFLDGRKLIDRVQRQGVISRLGQLAGRIVKLGQGATPPLMLAVTHRDAGNIDDTVRGRLDDELAKHGVAASIFPIAPFSDDAAIPAGSGIAELIEATVDNGAGRPAFWPSSHPDETSRSFLAWRRDR